MTETTTTKLTAAADLEGETYETRAYAASGATSALAPATIRRRTPGPHDVQIEVGDSGTWA